MVGGTSVLAACVFLLGALVNKEWISPDQGRWFWGAIEAAYSSYGFGFIVLVMGLVGLFIMHERLWLFIVKEKNKEISRVVDQRNKLEAILLKDRGSSDDGPRRRQRK